MPEEISASDESLRAGALERDGGRGLLAAPLNIKAMPSPVSVILRGLNMIHDDLALAIDPESLPTLVHLLSTYYHHDAWDEFSSDEKIWEYFISHEESRCSQRG
jgi:hypothetical protein